MQVSAANNLKYFFVIALVVLAVFGNSIFFDYIHLDEDVLVTGNSYFYKTSQILVEIFKHDAYFPSGTSAYYRPFYILSFVVDTFWGGSSEIFHATNVIFHILASFLIFIFLNKLQSFSNKTQDNSNGLPLILTLLFAIHPIVTQTVAWIPARGDSLLTIFLLTSIIFLIDYKTKKKAIYLISHFLFFFLALFSKETALVFPIVCFSLICLFRNNKLLGRHNLIIVSGWILLSGVWLIIRENIINTDGIYGLSVVQIFSTFKGGISIIVIYVGKIFLPINLSVFPLINDSSMIYGLIVIIALAVYMTLTRRHISPYSALGIIWMIVFLIPTLFNYDDPRQMAFFEHRAYLPLVGFLILIFDLVKNLKFKVFKIVGGLAILNLAAMSYGYGFNFKDRSVFWSEAVRVSPNSARAHAELAVVYGTENNFLEAENEFKRALEINPRERKVYNNLALLFIKQNKLEIAANYLKKELEIDPGSVIANFNLGNIYARQSLFEEAFGYWQKASKSDPNHILTHESLIKYYYLKKDLDKISYHINEIKKRGFPLSVEIDEILKDIN